MQESEEDDLQRGVRSLIPSQSPSCSAFRRPVMRLVFPQRMKSASLSWPMNACLHASALGERSSFSVGGEARWRVRRRGVKALGGAWGRADWEMVWLS